MGTGLSGVSHFLLQDGRPHDVAVIDAQHRYSYSDLRRTVARLVVELDKAAVPRGARVGILAANSFFWAAAYLAATTGRVAVPLSDKLPAPEVAGLARQVGLSVVFIDRTCRRRFRDAFDPGTLLLTDELLASEGALSRLSPAQVDRDADALLLFTSGTTAAAKAVRLTHRNVIANTESIISYLRLDRNDRMLVVLPFYYCYGLSLLNTHLRIGGSVVLCNNFVFPEVAIDTLEREHCTGFAGVPSTFQMLLRASSFGKRRLPDLRLIQQAGGKLPPALIQELLAAKPDADLFVMYGQTEATARLSYLPPDLVLERLGSIGRGIPGVELQVVDEVGTPVKPGVTGEIVARGDNISPGYLNDPEGSAAKFPRGLLRTGDLGTVDDHGFIYVVDRVADFIKSWGHRVSSQEIESCVLQLPDLVSAAAVGVEDAEAGEAIGLAVQLRPGSRLTIDELLRYARGHLAKHKVPKYAVIVDSIPLNGNGKIDKNRVRELVGSHSARH